MKVYVVLFQRFDNAPAAIVTVCSTEEKAKSFIPVDPNKAWWWQISEYELDGLVKTE
jgi:hypothetical protein